MLFCPSPKGSALPWLLPHRWHREAKPAGEAPLFPPAPSSRELRAASPRLQGSMPPFSRRDKRSIIVYGFSSLFLRCQPWYMIFGSSLRAVVSCQGMSGSGRCSFWRSWTGDSDSCQCRFLGSDIIKGFTSWRLVSFVVKSYSVPSSESYSSLSVLGVLCIQILFKAWGVQN